MLSARRILVLTACLLAPACVTLGKFESLQERVVILEREKDLLAEAIQRDMQRLDELRGLLGEAEKSLRSLTASQGSTLDDLRMDIARATGRMDELAAAAEQQQQQLSIVLDVLDEKLGATAALVPPDLPAEKEPLLALANQRLEQRMHRVARAIFRTYLQRFPNDEKAPQVAYMVAETYFGEAKWGPAIRSFQDVHDRFTKSEYAPRSLARIADCLEQQRNCQKALGVLQYLRDSFRKAPEAEQAAERIKNLRKTCK